MADPDVEYIPNNEMKVPLMFNHPYPAYKTTVTLKSKDLTDIRVMNLNMTIYPKPVRAKIEMRVSAGEHII